ncbi:hypothetical protein DUI87_16386 [Hirundo rustica rustica]|uniref:Uncharacterized protein n=1 Tax=Hirundo rustica rustica TaxID=333673 RepID=A0A3M0K137_HIRRU|nr:hypothetical protein DUI87_16386 [Hirundo rustica rustica]
MQHMKTMVKNIFISDIWYEATDKKKIKLKTKLLSGDQLWDPKETPEVVSGEVQVGYQIHWRIMELMTNLGDITEILAVDGTEKEFHMILRKEQQL